MSDPEPACNWLRLDPRVVGYMKRSALIRCAIEAAVVGTFAAIAVSEAWFTPASRTVMIALGTAWVVIDFVISRIVPRLHMQHTRYAVLEDRFEMRYGAWWRGHQVVPRSRIQYLDVTQGPLERAFGLGRINLYTAGTSNSEVSLFGLEHSVAVSLRDQLLASTEASEDGV